MKFDKLKEECISSKEIYNGRVMHMFVDEVRLPNGDKSTREYVKHNGAVAVIPIDSEGYVYLVKQYRYPFSKVLTEIPAGKLDSRDEDHLEAAMRELREETGFTCKKVTFLGEFIGSPALIGETIWLYLAQDLEAGEQDLDRDEFLNVVKMPFDELLGQVMSGEITDGKTICAVLKTDKIRHES